MPTHLPRASFCLAAVAGGVALASDGPMQAVCAAIAIGSVFVAYQSWRAGLAQRLKARKTPAESSSRLQFDEAAVAEAEARIAHAASGAQYFEAALHAVAVALQGEIGARAHRVYAIAPDVEASREGAAVLLEMFPNQAGFRAAARPFGPREVAIARSIREQREVAAFPLALAVPVVRLGAVVAVVEWRSIDIAIGLGEVARLLQATRVALDKVAAIEAARVAAAEPDTLWPDTLMQSAGQGRT